MDVQKFKLYQQTRDATILHELVRENANLVGRTIQKYRTKTFAAYLEMEDLYQYGIEGLIKAIESYSPEKSAFSTYATYWIKEACIEALRRDGPVRRSRSYTPTIDTMNRVAAFEARNGRLPTHEDIGLDPKTFLPHEIQPIAFLSLDFCYHPLSGEDPSKTLDEVRGGKNEIYHSLYELIPDLTVSSALDNTTRIERGKLILKHISNASRRSYGVLVHVFVFYRSFRETARALRIKEPLVRRICEEFAHEIESAYA